MGEYKIIIDGTKDVYMEASSTFEDLINKYFISKKFEIALCKFNNKFYEMGAKLPGDGHIQEMIPFNCGEGAKIYSRTLQYIFIKATLDTFPNSKIVIEHSIGKGLFGEIYKETPLTADNLKLIKLRMEEIINSNMTIKKVKVRKEEAIRIFKSYGMEDKVLLLSQVDFEWVKLYELDGRYDYFYGHMAQSTGTEFEKYILGCHRIKLRTNLTSGGDGASAVIGSETVIGAYARYWATRRDWLTALWGLRPLLVLTHMIMLRSELVCAHVMAKAIIGCATDRAKAL